MTKELEAFRDILGILSAVSGCEVDMNSERVIAVKSALQRLEAIDNANSSKALEWLEHTGEQWVEDGIYENVVQYKETQSYREIKQALIKAQEQEKELKEQKELLDILKNKPFILQRIFEEKGLKNQKEFDQKYFWGTIAGEEEFKIMRWLDKDKSE